MAEPIEVTRRIESPLSAGQVRERVLDHLASVRAKLSDGPEGEIVARRGSHMLIRLLGAYLMPRALMPTIARIDIQPAGTGSEVAITVADDFGFGFRTGMKKRYQRLLTDQLDGIATALG